MWRKFRQAICWLLKGRNEMECLFAVYNSKPKEVICEGCKHNQWRKL